eukprot:m.159625 g.159625  ORF g.159625 m.159625 type:complete len:66 (-) comp31142_c0_seq1:47-244(-)
MRLCSLASQLEFSANRKVLCDNNVELVSVDQSKAFCNNRISENNGSSHFAQIASTFALLWLWLGR